VLKADVHKYAFIPQGKTEPALSGKALIEHDKYPEDVNEKDLEQHVASAIRAHMKDFLAAIQSRGKPVADIEHGTTSSIASILANISMQVGRTLTWDNSKGEIVGDPEANKLLRRPYRAPWEHPEVASV